MTFHVRIRSFLPLALLVAATVACLLAPAGAGAAILVGAESNSELVNSNLTPALQDEALARMQKQGVQVVRGNFGWNEIATACGGQTPQALEDPDHACYNWTLLDSFVQQANARGMKVLISLTRNPAWANNDFAHPMNMGITTQQFNVVANHYAAFYKAAGSRFQPGTGHGVITFWTIHNEPNSPVYWYPRPNPQRYALLYAKTAVALRSVYPAALIAPGPTGPTGGKGMKPIPFIASFQKYATMYLPGTIANKRRYINAWAHNPYPGFANQPSTAKAGSNPQIITMATIDRLFVQLDTSPLTRGAKVWATEFGWETSGNFSTSTTRQAQFIAEAFDWLDSKRRVTIGISYGLTDPPADPPAPAPSDFQSGTFFHNGLAKPSFKMFQRMVSVPQAGLGNKVRRGTLMRVWGRSNVASATGRLAYKLPGGVWRLVPGARHGGTMVGTMRVTSRTISFAVYDKGNQALGIPEGYGLMRTISTY